MEWMLPLFSLIGGLAAGFAAAWLWMRARIEHEKTQAIAVMQADLAGQAARLQGRDQEIERLEEAIAGQKQQLEDAAEKELVATQKEAELATSLAKEKEKAKELVETFDDARKQLKETFDALASRALKSNNEDFLRLAKETFAKTSEKAQGDLEKRHQAIDTLVKPIKESLEKVDGKIQQLEKARVGAYQSLHEQVKAMTDTHDRLFKETHKLVSALKQPTARGRWGEHQLHRVVELAGMQEHCDYVEQVSVEGDDGRQRPDMVIHLAGNKQVLVDAKVPLTAYLKAIEVEDEEERKTQLELHARAVRDHMLDLSRKQYWESFGDAPEFVVLFLPGEIFFSAALQHDPELFEFGASRNVILASPMTLMALLKAVSYGWQQEQMAKSAEEIGQLGKDLYKRLATYGGHIEKVGKQLAKTVDTYNASVGSLDSQVMSAARRFQDFVPADEKKQIPELPEIAQTTRIIRSAELAADKLSDAETTDSKRPRISHG
ncbi:MAG: DNA recombination protein RmuC [Pirellulales bacterium]|nr:DNA recombination protein RmuC [Pirellulales bacterium]